MTTVLLALVSVLSMQFAVAAYACASVEAAGQDRAALSAAQPDPAPLPGCDQQDPTQPALCHAHCQDGKLSLDKPGAPTIPPALAVGSFVPVFDWSATQGPLAGPQRSLLTRNTAPPLSIRNCCFRI